MPIPTTSTLAIWLKSMGSSVSSRILGSPHWVPVAAARTYSQRGVITATPNDKLLGFIKCTRDGNRSPLSGMQYHTVSQDHTGRNLPLGGQGEESRWHTVHDRPPTSDSGSRPALRNVTI